MGKKKQLVNKLCARCSLDCIVVRALAVEQIPDSKRAEFLKNRFGEGKPIYTRDTCPKKNWKK